MHDNLISANLNENKELAKPNFRKFPLDTKPKADCPTAGGIIYTRTVGDAGPYGFVMCGTICAGDS